MITNVTVSFEQKTCPVCGVHYAVDSAYMAVKLERGGDWYCPNGHNLIFTQTTADKLKKELAETRKKLNQQVDSTNYFSGRLNDVVKERDTLGRTLKASKTRLRKVKDRVANGVCPCCNRTFENLQRHMSKQHPTFKDAE